MAEADAATKSGATQKLVPRALWWFRWSAAVTFLAGVVILGLRRGGRGGPPGGGGFSGAAPAPRLPAPLCWRVSPPLTKRDSRTRGPSAAGPAAPRAAG